MKTYYGKRCQLGATISIREEDGTTRSLRHLVLHSPTGMEWGYGGSGPADTALSILADHFGERPKNLELLRGRTHAGVVLKCLQRYQDFKWAFIASAPKEGFEITAVQIDAWLLEQDHARGVCPCEMCQSRWVGADEAGE